MRLIAINHELTHDNHAINHDYYFLSIDSPTLKQTLNNKQHYYNQIYNQVLYMCFSMLVNT